VNGLDSRGGEQIETDREDEDLDEVTSEAFGKRDRLSDETEL
jgi:hypothetical protein